MLIGCANTSKNRVILSSTTRQANRENVLYLQGFCAIESYCRHRYTIRHAMLLSERPPVRARAGVPKKAVKRALCGFSVSRKPLTGELFREQRTLQRNHLLLRPVVQKKASADDRDIKTSFAYNSNASFCYLLLFYAGEWPPLLFTFFVYENIRTGSMR